MKLSLKKIFLPLKVFGISVLLLVLIGFAYRTYLKTAYPIKYEEYVNQSSNVYGVEPELVYAIIRTESKFDATAVSSAGAIGLMQIIPSTFEWMNSKKNILSEEKDLFSPEQNIDCGVHLISFLLSKYQNFDTAVCAYNAGIGTVDKWLADPKISQDGTSLNDIPYPETKTYLQRIKKSYRVYHDLYFKN